MTLLALTTKTDPATGNAFKSGYGLNSFILLISLPNRQFPLRRGKKRKENAKCKMQNAELTIFVSSNAERAAVQIQSEKSDRTKPNLHASSQGINPKCSQVLCFRNDAYTIFNNTNTLEYKDLGHVSSGLVSALYLLGSFGCSNMCIVYLIYG